MGKEKTQKRSDGKGEEERDDQDKGTSEVLDDAVRMWDAVLLRGGK